MFCSPFPASSILQNQRLWHVRKLRDIEQSRSGHKRRHHRFVRSAKSQCPLLMAFPLALAKSTISSVTVDNSLGDTEGGHNTEIIAVLRGHPMRHPCIPENIHLLLECHLFLIAALPQYHDGEVRASESSRRHFAGCRRVPERTIATVATRH